MFFSQKQLFAHCFSEIIHLFGSIEIKYILQILCWSKSPRSNQKSILRFSKTKDSLSSKLVASSGLTSDVTINRLAHYPFLFVIFRCRMGFIKGQCNNRGQLYFIMKKSLFSETLRHPSGASALGGQFAFDNLTHWTIMFHCSINLAL